MANLTFTYDITDNNRINWLSGDDYVGLQGASGTDALILGNIEDGPLQAQITDGTAVGGLARGNFATDWQRNRFQSARVASGIYSTIGGGRSNRAHGSDSAICGGNQNQALPTGSFVGGGSLNIIDHTGTYGMIGGGAQNGITSALDSVITGGRRNDIEVTSSYSTIGGGVDNLISGTISGTIAGGDTNVLTGSVHSSILGGNENTINDSSLSVIVGGNNNEIDDSTLAFIGGGNSNIIDDAAGAVISGGSFNEATGPASAIPGGTGNLAETEYSLVFGQNGVSNHPGEVVASYVSQQWNPGVAQRSTVQWNGTTSNSSNYNLTLGDTGLELELETNTTYVFQIHIVGITTSGSFRTAAWQFAGAITRDTGTSVLLTSSLELISSGHISASGWNSTIVTSGNNLRVQVNGDSSLNVRWTATGYLTKIKRG